MRNVYFKNRWRQITILIILPLSLSLLLAQKSTTKSVFFKQQDVQNDYNLALEAIAMKDYDTAIGYLKQVLAENNLFQEPSGKSAWHQLGFVLEALLQGRRRHRAKAATGPAGTPGRGRSGTDHAARISALRPGAGKGQPDPHHPRAPGAHVAVMPADRAPRRATCARGAWRTPASPPRGRSSRFHRFLSCYHRSCDRP